MDLAVLPGPSLAELARTAVARATAATIACQTQPAGSCPQAGVAMRADPAGQPILLPAPGSALARQLAARPAQLTVCVCAEPPFSALRLSGCARPGGPGSARAAYHVTLRSAEFTGAGGRHVPLASYLAAAPDPLWREAPGILRHLSRGHMGELVACIRAQELPQAEWVMPSGLDRFGLRLLVLTPDGVAVTRLSFPGGPVASFSEVPPSLRAVLACRCQASRLSPGGRDPGT
jgi:hypothetical protein